MDRKVQVMIGNPTEDKFKQMMSLKLLTNFPVILDNITNSRTILGPQKAVIQGGTVRKI